MNLPSLARSFPLTNKQERDLLIALNVLKTFHKRRFQPSYLLKFARRSRYNPALLVRIVRTCRVRRQQALRGAYIQPMLHPVRSFRLYLTASLLQNQMEDLFRRIFCESGNEEFLETVAQARFVTPEYLLELRTERSHHLKKEEYMVMMDECLRHNS